MNNKILILFIITVFLSIQTQGQTKIFISGNYNIGTSHLLKDNFKNGYGATAEIHHFFNETGFSASLLFGLNSFRATSDFEQELENNNPTLFDYDYQIHYNNFPIFVSGHYTFFNKKKFNIMTGIGAGVNFIEYKRKQIGDITSDTEKDHYTEFAIYPSLGISYKIFSDISIMAKGSLNKSFGDQKIEYYSLSLGLIYNI